jgi:NAD(P)H-hydrate epimerase
MPIGYSAAQVRAAEAPHLAAGEPLMARAAGALARVLRGVLEDRRGSGLLRGERPRVVLLAGPGNNAGDALYAGAELAAEGAGVDVLVVLDRTHEDGLAAALAAGAAVLALDNLLEAAAAADVIVDGMFGTGSAGRSPALSGIPRDAVTAILPLLAGPEAPAVVAVDIPSGIDADDGTVPDPVVLPADVTVTFGGMKAGLLLPPAKDLAGEVIIVDIGIGDELRRSEPILRLPD